MAEIVIPTEKGFESVYEYDDEGNLLSHQIVKHKSLGELSFPNASRDFIDD